MSNVIYDAARVAFAKKQIDWEADTIGVSLINTSLYTFSQSHLVLADVAAGSRVAFSTLDNRSVSSIGGMLADATTVFAVSGAQVSALIIYWQGVSEATSTLLTYLDTLAGLPYTPTGADVLLSWNNTTSGIFRL